MALGEPRGQSNNELWRQASPSLEAMTARQQELAARWKDPESRALMSEFELKELGVLSMFLDKPDMYAWKMKQIMEGSNEGVRGSVQEKKQEEPSKKELPKEASHQESVEELLKLTKEDPLIPESGVSLFDRMKTTKDDS
jgi:hypothetical protein